MEGEFYFQKVFNRTQNSGSGVAIQRTEAWKPTPDGPTRQIPSPSPVVWFVLWRQCVTGGRSSSPIGGIMFSKKTSSEHSQMTRDATVETPLAKRTVSL